MAAGRVKNWGEFQHYKDRSPPWIKLHRALLDDFQFTSLPLASKALAPMVWLLAAESSDGSVNLDPEWLAWRLRIPVEDVREGLSPLIERGFLVSASTPLATRKQGAIPEGERETERETEREAEGEKEPDGSLPPDGAAPCPQKEIVALYHELLPTHPAVKVWDGDRAKALRSRWREDRKRQSLDYWRRFFVHVAASPFLTGRVEGQSGRPFVATLDWLVKRANFIKVIENRYHDRKARP